MENVRKGECKKKFPKVFRDVMEGNVNGTLPTAEEIMAELSKWVVSEPTTDLLNHITAIFSRGTGDTSTKKSIHQ